MEAAYKLLRQTLNSYHVLPEESWKNYLNCCSLRSLDKGQTLCAIGDKPSSFAFIFKGLIRAYVLDAEGNEFNKNFFAEGRFPGSMTSLLKNETSWMGIEALEDSELIEIDFSKFRDALFQDSNLMQMHINYLETHWLIEKEPKEIGFLQDEAKQRYLSFLDSFAAIKERVPLYHVASYLGITATQLSRIRKEI